MTPTTVPPNEDLAPRYAERVAASCEPVTLRDGRRAWIGPLLPGDRETLSEEYTTLSPETRWHRFLAGVPRLTSTMLDHLVDGVDGVDHIALVAFVEDAGRILPAGIGRIVRYRELPDAADMAVTIKDEWQGIGLGSLLSTRLVERRPEGVTHRPHRSRDRQLGLAGDDAPPRAQPGPPVGQRGL